MFMLFLDKRTNEFYIKYKGLVYIVRGSDLEPCMHLPTTAIKVKKSDHPEVFKIFTEYVDSKKSTYGKLIIKMIHDINNDDTIDVLWMSPFETVVDRLFSIYIEIEGNDKELKKQFPNNI